MKSLKNISILIILGVLLASLALSGCDVIRLPGQAEAAAQPTLPPVQADQGVIAEGHIVPRDSANLAFKAPGNVAELHVKEGDLVKKGDVLARLDNKEQYDAAVAAASLEHLNAQQALGDLNKKADLAKGQAQQALVQADQALVEAQQKLADLDTDSYQQQIDDAWVEVTKAQDDLDTAKEDFDKYKSLDKENQNYKNADQALKDAQKKYDDLLRAHDRLVNDRDALRAAVALSLAARDDAQRQVDARQNGPDADQLALAQSRLENATAQLNAAQKASSDLDLLAPFDGTITDVSISQGEQVVPNQPVIQIADLSQLYSETSDLTELDVVKVKEGQSVQVVADALPDVTMKGTIDSIARVSREKSGDIVYTVRVLLDSPDSSLRWGMTTKNTFEK